jgi:C1A family cysteine protease
LGWRRDSPDFRDYTPSNDAVAELLNSLESASNAGDQQPRKMDLREHMWEVDDQGGVNASAAYACLGLVEYFQQRSHGSTIETSKLFLYKMARKLMGVESDAGAELRTCFKALLRFGAPPSKHWPRAGQGYDAEPADPLLFCYADAYRSIRYVRLDPPNSPGSLTLETVKSFLAAGFACAFGAPIPSSISRDPSILYRPTFDQVLGGQALVAMGYDDERRAATKGALVVRNSWGADWGEDGYGWLPYIFVERQMAADFWTVLKEDWLASGEFFRPNLPHQSP